MSPHERSNRRCASTCCTHSPGSTCSGSAPMVAPNASARECAASVLSTNVRNPWRAPRTAVPAAAVVLPTPPLPVKRSTRATSPESTTDSGSATVWSWSTEGLDPPLQALQGSVDDDLLGLAPEHADHGDRELDRELVGHLGAAVDLLEDVRALHGLEHLRLDERPGDLLVVVPV